MKRILENIKIAFKSLGLNKLRSFLTMLGIIIGVGSVVAVMSVGAGAEASITENIQSMGTNVITISPGREQVFAGSVEIKLTKKEFMILEYLLRHKGQLVSRNQILEHAWDRNVDIFTNIVDTHIKNLRKKLGKSGRLIKTVYGSGYRILDDE